MGGYCAFRFTKTAIVGNFAVRFTKTAIGEYTRGCIYLAYKKRGIASCRKYYHRIAFFQYLANVLFERGLTKKSTTNKEAIEQMNEKANSMDMIRAKWATGARVCVGLDPVWEKIPGKYRCGLNVHSPSARRVIHDYFLDIARATSPYAGAFKPNHSFFEGYGETGLAAAAALYRSLRREFPDTPLILDFKRQDIGKTNAQLLLMLKEHGATAATFHPYLGMEASQPFLDEGDLGNFILCKTSNPGSGEFQNKQFFVSEAELRALFKDNGGDSAWNGIASACHWVGATYGDIRGFFVPNYQYVALRVSRGWNKKGNCGLVVGGTYPSELAAARTITGPDVPILIPGYGAQGASLEDLCKAGMNPDGTGILVNESSSICYPAKEEENPFQAAAKRAKETNDKIASFVTETALS